MSDRWNEDDYNRDNYNRDDYAEESPKQERDPDTSLQPQYEDAPLPERDYLDS